MRPHAVDPQPRVELRCYLAGVPFSHRRALSAAERRALGRRVAPNLVGAGLCGLVAAASFANVVRLAWLSELGVDRVFGGFLLSAISVLVSLAFLHWARPFRTSLRSGELHVYIGSMRPLEGFDAAHAHYLKRLEFRSNLDRYVEVLAVGDGNRIWKIEGVGNSTALDGVRVVRVAVVPDIDEKGTRPLTEEESEELLLRSVEYGTFWFEAVNLFLAAFAGLLLFAIVSVNTVGFWIGVSLAVLFPLLSISRDLAAYFPRRRFAKTLTEDRQAHVVVDGALASGIPWVVGGEPARWRLGWTKGVQNRVSQRGAAALEEAVEKP